MTGPRLAAVAATAVAAILAALAAWGPAAWQAVGTAHRHAETHPPADTRPHTCGMHPQVIQQGPGRCPICAMELVPMQAESAQSVEGGPPGVRVSRHFVQNFAVRAESVERSHLPAEIRTIGYLDQDEARLVSVSAKFEGWIERAWINTVGERVSEGDRLFEVYSPELVTAQQEYLAAIEFAGRLRERGAYADAVRRAESLVQAARGRLVHWDVSAEQIDSLRNTGEVTRTVDIHAPAAGLVVEKAGDSLEGMRVTPGVTVVKIADHSTLWAKVEFYEHDVRDLRIGLRAEITLDAFPGRAWDGEVLFFRPSMNPQTQTLTGFVEVDNTNGLLRPKMYATVRIRLPGVRNALVVPAQSVLHSGDRAVVIVAEGAGYYTPREVELGLETGGRVQVLRGVEEGERVVTSSQFLIDSESNLRTAITNLLEPGGDAEPGPSRRR